MAEDFKVSVAPAVDAAAAEAAGGGAGGGGAGGPEFFSSGGLLRGAGAPLPSFTVVAADVKNSTFKVVRPYVYVTGYGEVSVAPATFGFGAAVYCVVTREKQKSGGYTYTAKLAGKEDDSAFACVKVAEIPAMTSMFACGGVMQFHSGAIIIATPSDLSLATKDITMVTRLEDASASDSTLRMKYFTKTVSVVVPETSGSDGDESEPSESVTIAHFYEQKYVTDVVYDPSGHELYHKYREEKLVVVDARSGDDSESSKVFTAEPVCGKG